MDIPKIDSTKLAETMELIDRIANEIQNGTNANDELVIYENQLKALTGKNDIDINSFAEYWGWTTLEDLAKSVLMPVPQLQGLSDKELTEIIVKIIKCKYSESETDYQLKVLERETGLTNISDYIFYPNEVGLDLHADISEIVSKILSDKKY